MRADVIWRRVRKKSPYLFPTLPFLGLSNAELGRYTVIRLWKSVRVLDADFLDILRLYMKVARGLNTIRLRCERSVNDLRIICELSMNNQ